MANVDNPKGLWPVGHLCGGEILSREYTVTTGATIYQGDPVEMVSGGTVDPAAASDGVKMVGVAAETVSDAASVGGKKIQIYDDPKIIFGIQCVTGQTPSAASIGLSAAANTYATGDTTTKLSKTELGALSAQTEEFFCIGLVDSPDNVWGEHADVMVIFNEHRYKGAGTAGI